MTSRTSLIISGSSAEVGSSNSMAIGSIDSARAIATRCCWPPESWPGYLSLWREQPDAIEELQAPLPRFILAAVEHLDLPEGQVLGDAHVRERSKFWNTMPMRERSFGRSVPGAPTETPSTVIVPFWKGSSALTHLMRVDLAAARGPADHDHLALGDAGGAVGEHLKVPYHC